MIKCLVVDDEPLAQQVLQRYIDQTPGLTFTASCANAMEAFQFLSITDVNLMFLDIKMPALNGVDFVRSLKNPPPVIFTTAFSEYAIESYELDAVDYLLKPVTYERFEKSVSKFFKQNTVSEIIPAYTYFKVDGKLVRIEHETFIYAQSIKDYVIIFTTKGNYITHMTMKYLAELLPPTAFQRVHRSYLVGIKYISGLDNQKLYLGEIPVPIGDSFKIDVFSLRNKLSKIDK
ncbi:LytR/AlgR family response regulator transcription factor [Dyadobacter subterraneus]|uniref:Response regulator transcription factor n=1 Tax=Dyadobacter subterraneus TaxID=2773304 RepID=A0ABR9WGY8_9BACT|nr:LytTR family DNA-binding domain-containing protein [Dyadobacter subterraneus]MBE9463611.1 response regulator transcription factor [Dyadobacter subterraneus]